MIRVRVITARRISLTPPRVPPLTHGHPGAGCIVDVASAVVAMEYWGAESPAGLNSKPRSGRTDGSILLEHEREKEINE